MLKGIDVSGYAVLCVGVVLLAFTFYNAYGFLQGILEIPASEEGLMGVFGEALAPLISTAIRAMYLGIMGWIGSILTIRGVQLLSVPRVEVKPEAKPEAEEAKPQKAAKSSKKSPEASSPSQPAKAAKQAKKEKGK